MRTAVLALPLIAIAIAGCAEPAAAPPAPPAPITVVSVDSWAAMTLSTGDKVYDVDSNNAATGSCQETYLTQRAREMIVGQQIVAYTEKSSSPYATAPPGYMYGGFDYSGSTRVWQDVNDLYAGEAARLCGPPTSPEPLPTTTSEPGPGPDIYVQNEDDHHESRFCRRRWWC